MSLFENLGERVERFKQAAVSASEDRAEFACQACGEPVYTDQRTCPHCGEEAVVRIEPEPEPEPESEPDTGEDEPGRVDESESAARGKDERTEPER